MSAESLHSTCPFCHQSFTSASQEIVHFCPFCGQEQDKKEETEENQNNLLSNRYKIVESIGKGGMGEVFLAYDITCGRRIALKKIRSDLLEHPQIRRRFLKEAHITCQLTHPAIIPIYSIRADQLSAYYTMPFVEGDTLKQIIRKTRQQEKREEKLHHIGGSIPALMRIFLTICQAVAYAHAKQVIHRDLKPENIIVGPYGEVLLLDWGLAKHLNTLSQEDNSIPSSITPPHLTRIGKVVGTVAYMAPERAIGHPATIQTDIYALGVILYQLLTLKSPFKRSSLEEFRKNMAQEEYVDPVSSAPYRDVPHMLARLTDKCLSPHVTERYQTVDELIRDLEDYIEGRSEWFHMAQLDIKNKADWEFQENVLIAEHMAVTRATEEAEWVSLMISHQSFTGNCKIETTVCLGENCHGIGLLLSIPEASERTYINDGYCLWLGSDKNRSTQLLRSNVEVMQAPDIFLKQKQDFRIRIEKIEKTIHFYLNDTLQFSYIAHIPLIGTHIGLLARDDDFEMTPLEVSVGSLNLTVNCLAVPDAFLAHHDFTQALSEYRRIAYSFPDRAEGREALFRAGLTFLEQAKGHPDKTLFLNQALQEFEKLHGTPGAPLEYLGKALVYQTLNEEEEEIKCFELAYRRYPKHPLLAVLQEQIFSRMHEVSRLQRMMTYRFVLLSVRHLPYSTIDTHTRRLFMSLQKHWEILPFMEEPLAKPHASFALRLAIPLAFWLARPYILGEIIEDLLEGEPFMLHELGNAWVSLIELGAFNYAEQKLAEIKQHKEVLLDIPWQDLESLLACHRESLEQVYQTYFSQPMQEMTFTALRALLYWMDQALDQQQPGFVHLALQNISCELSFDMRLRLDTRRIWAFLLEKDWEQAKEVLHTYPFSLLNKESTPLYFLYSCWLAGTNETEQIPLLNGLLHISYPRSWTLANYYLLGDLEQTGWLDKAFFWEKKQLYRQLNLYYHCAGKDKQKHHFYHLYQKQVIHVE